MNQTLLLDACALVAFFANEPGGEIVSEILISAIAKSSTIFMHKLNLLEFYYGVLRAYGKTIAEEALAMIADSPIEIIREISDKTFQEAARLKAAYKISLADSIALAEARTQNASLVTCDHHEFDPLEQAEPISFLWIR